MDAVWDVLFTPAFAKQFKKVPGDRLAILEKYLPFLRSDPFALIKQAKRLRTKARLFRIRLGDWRLVYRVHKKSKRVVLIRIAPRGAVYELLPPDADEGRPIEALLPGTKGPDASPEQEPEPKPEHAPQPQTAPVPPSTDEEGIRGAVQFSTDVDVESDAGLLDEHELFLLGIPEVLWPSIVALRDEAGLDRAGLPGSVAERIEDYLTVPGEGQIGKLYRLGAQQGLSDIRARPLSDFLLELDPDQKEMVNRPIDKGPYLIRGGPGTGKTLVALHRLYRVWSERSSEDLFGDQGRPWFLFVTFNRSLLGVNERLFERMVNQSDISRVRFETFDRLVNLMIKKHKARLPHSLTSYSIPSEKDLEELLFTTLENWRALNPSDTTGKKLIEGHDVEFFHDEFEQVINGNGILILKDYLDHSRTGCRVRLGKRQRESLWSMFEVWQRSLLERRWQTWEGKRLGLLRALDNGDLDIRKANAVVADEVQDLTPTAIRILVQLVSDVRFLSLSADSGQSIYHRPLNWKEISSELTFTRGNSFVLRRSWRMTKEIALALAPLRVDDGENGGSETPEPVLSGPRPRWRQIPTYEHLWVCLEYVRYAVRDRGLNPGQIAIICRYKSQVDKMTNFLGENGVKSAVLDRNSSLEFSDDCIHVMTAFSAKGIEFPFVIVPFASEGVYPSAKVLYPSAGSEEREEWVALERKLLYVALSRASRFLFMLSDSWRPSRFLNHLNKADWNLH